MAHHNLDNMLTTVNQYVGSICVLLFMDKTASTIQKGFCEQQKHCTSKIAFGKLRRKMVGLNEVSAEDGLSRNITHTPLCTTKKAQLDSICNGIWEETDTHDQRLQ